MSRRSHGSRTPGPRTKSGTCRIWSRIVNQYSTTVGVPCCLPIRSHIWLPFAAFKPLGSAKEKFGSAPCYGLYNPPPFRLYALHLCSTYCDLIICLNGKTVAVIRNASVIRTERRISIKHSFFTISVLCYFGYLTGLRVYLLKINICCSKLFNYRYHIAYSQKIFFWCLVIYSPCRKTLELKVLNLNGIIFVIHKIFIWIVLQENDKIRFKLQVK